MQLSLIVGSFAGVAYAQLAPRPYNVAQVTAAAHSVTPLPTTTPISLAVPVNTVMGNDTMAVWTTQTVTAYKTFCPSPTSWIQNRKTYTATKSEWVTITDCPQACTITYKSGPSPTVVPVLPPTPKQNSTSTYVPLKATTIQTTVCPKDSPCAQAPTSSQTKAPAYTPKAFTNSTVPVVKPSSRIRTSKPLSTVTTTNNAGQTIISIQQQQPGTFISSVTQDSTMPAQTVVTTNQAGSTFTSITPATTVQVTSSGRPVPSVVQTAAGSQVRVPSAALAFAAGVAVYFWLNWLTWSN